MEQWNMQQLREYISFVKHNVQPDLSAEANDDRQSARTTVRLLESLVRLSEAHAKVMMRDEVGIEDAITAITCVSLSQMSSNISLLSSATADGGKGVPNEMDSSDSLQQQYQKQEDKLFERLHLTRSSLKELCRQDAKQFAVAIAESSSSSSSSSGGGAAAIAAGETIHTAEGGAMVRDVASFFLPDDSTDIGQATNGDPVDASNDIVPHPTRRQQFWDMDDPDLIPKQSSSSLSSSLAAPNRNKRQRFPSLYDVSGDEEEVNGQYRTRMVPQLRSPPALPRPNPTEVSTMQPTRQSVAVIDRLKTRPTISDEHLEDW
eukprot:gene31983-42676_t